MSVTVSTTANAIRTPVTEKMKRKNLPITKTPTRGAEKTYQIGYKSAQTAANGYERNRKTYGQKSRKKSKILAENEKTYRKNDKTYEGKMKRTPLKDDKTYERWPEGKQHGGKWVEKTPHCGQGWKKREIRKTQEYRPTRKTSDVPERTAAAGTSAMHHDLAGRGAFNSCQSRSYPQARVSLRILALVSKPNGFTVLS